MIAAPGPGTSRARTTSNGAVVDALHQEAVRRDLGVQDEPGADGRARGIAAQPSREAQAEIRKILGPSATRAPRTRAFAYGRRELRGDGDGPRQGCPHQARSANVHAGVAISPGRRSGARLRPRNTACRSAGAPPRGPKDHPPPRAPSSS